MPRTSNHAPGNGCDQRLGFIRMAMNGGCSFTEAVKKHAALPETLARMRMRAESRTANRALRVLAQAEATKRREDKKAQRQAQIEACKKAQLEQHSANGDSGQEQNLEQDLEISQIECPSKGQGSKTEGKRRKATASKPGQLQTSAETSCEQDLETTRPGC